LYWAHILSAECSRKLVRGSGLSIFSIAVLASDKTQ